MFLFCFVLFCWQQKGRAMGLFLSHLVQNQGCEGCFLYSFIHSMCWEVSCPRNGPFHNPIRKGDIVAALIPVRSGGSFITYWKVCATSHFATDVGEQESVGFASLGLRRRWLANRDRVAFRKATGRRSGPWWICQSWALSRSAMPGCSWRGTRVSTWQTPVRWAEAGEEGIRQHKRFV